MVKTRKTSTTVAAWIPFVVAAILPPCSESSNVVESVDVPDLRFAKNNGTIGRFAVPRPALEGELERLGLSGKVELLSSSSYDSECEGEVSLFIQNIADITLQKDLPPELLDQVSISGNLVTFTLPVVSSDNHHSVIMLAYFSDAPSPFLSPYLTSVEAVRHVESIDVGDGFVTLRHGCDVMNITVDHEEGCSDSEVAGADFDNVTGNDVRLSSFPLGFDWGCDILGSGVSFCRRLESHMDGIKEANGDVCTTMSTSNSRRCPASMRIDSITGVFRDSMRFLADLVPVESFEAEYIVREHEIGVVFPCF